MLGKFSTYMKVVYLRLTNYLYILKISALKPEIIEKLEKERDEELADRREKRKKAIEEEEAKKADIQKKSSDSNADQKMEVGN